jgi:glycosyltransferase involved in cell wall biosynthesis
MTFAMPLFDVILPTRGRAHTIPYSIASVLDQTAGDFTLHVVGDGCDSATEEAVRSIGDPRIRFRRFLKGSGFGYEHRNTVLRESSAPFVAYMTDDDLWFPDHLERGINALAERDLALVALKSAQVRYPDALDLWFFAFDWRLGALSRFLNRWFIGSAHLVHRRTLFDRVGYWDDRLFRFGDREFYQRAYDSGQPTAFLPETTLLRFYAGEWDRRYGRLPAPPQKKYLELIRDPRWRADARASAAAPQRSLAVRLGQARDFASFAGRSGRKFARYLLVRRSAPSGSAPHR